ncbi:hypothetical protein [Mesorhizobium sp. B2-3-5]|uniref:hypothetical protein n=1 Tax=Mesorhizobium sp. B2-3-5 TaxID=2589958 RepID=UPI00112EA10B|nr:hypothetical protein [Mesorhizobium sp. B2-3-5]TPM12571.1 hypothetical protein FJ958_31365 [Mesorhizobium sp. B2-3-5]
MKLRAVWWSLVRGPEQPIMSDWIIGIANDGIRVHAAGWPEFQSRPLDIDATSDEIAVQLRSGASASVRCVRSSSPETGAWRVAVVLASWNTC